MGRKETRIEQKRTFLPRLKTKSEKTEDLEQNRPKKLIRPSDTIL